MELTGKIYIVEKKYSGLGNASYTCLLVDQHNIPITIYTKANSSLANDVKTLNGKDVKVELSYSQTKDKFYLTDIDKQ